MMATGSELEKLEKNLNVEFLEGFLEAIPQVFETQGNTKFLPEEMFVFDKSRFPEKLEVISSIGVTSSKMSGSVTLGFTRPAFVGVFSKMLEQDIEVENEEFLDCASEMLNMAFGMVKADLTSRRKIDISPAIPMVVRADNIRFNIKCDDPTMIIPFNSEFGRIFCAITISLVK